MPDIFLSYSRDDQATARRFAEAFEREGFSVWWDQTLQSRRGLRPGDREGAAGSQGRRRAVVEEVRGVALGARRGDAGGSQRDAGAGDDRALQAADHVRADADGGSVALEGGCEGQGVAGVLAGVRQVREEGCTGNPADSRSRPTAGRTKKISPIAITIAVAALVIAGIALVGVNSRARLRCETGRLAGFRGARK